MPGDWMFTYCGGRFYPLDPRPEAIFPQDVAHSLSLLCRFTGHCRTFYSVAEHSVIVSRLVPPEDALWGLLHDASEAYVNDLSRPLKHSPEMAPYVAAERRVIEAVAARFGLALPMPESVKSADQLVVQNEMAELIRGQAHRPSRGHWAVGRGDVSIRGLDPREAEREFLDRFQELGGRVL